MESIWNIDKTPPSENSLNRDIKTDVLIIGGGLCGVLCAYKLKQRGIDCIIAEKDEICSGNTACSTAKINAQHGLIYENLFNTFGKEGAYECPCHGSRYDRQGNVLDSPTVKKLK